MIHTAKNKLTESGFNEIKQITDNFGTIGYGLRFMGDNYVLVAKEYAHNDLASFMEKLVVNLCEDADFIFYNNDTESFTVFDGQYLNENSEKSSGPSKKRDCLWREIDLNHGAELDAFVRGVESPDSLAGGNETLETFL